jgi:hypothetical protein
LLVNLFLTCADGNFAENPGGADFYAPFAAGAIFPVYYYDMLMPKKADSAENLAGAYLRTLPARFAPSGIYQEKFCANSFQIFHKYTCLTQRTN